MRDDTDEPPPVPWNTLGLIAVSALAFLYLNLAPDDGNRKRLALFLAPDAIMIWNGAWWGLLTSAFIHAGPFHLLFNMWWTKDFGSVLESTIGATNLLLLVISSAFASSAAQLAFTGETGIGFSGVVYALFGFTLASRGRYPAHELLTDKGTVRLLLGWLVLCYFLTAFEIMPIGNAAHLGGFVFGSLTGVDFSRKRHALPAGAGLAAFAVMIVLSLVYMPWNDGWLERRRILEYREIERLALEGDRDARHRFARFLGDMKTADQIRWLESAAGVGSGYAMNNLAWVLATDPRDEIRDGPRAVELARRACELSDWKDPVTLDTLAAAYAEVGAWEKAVETQERAAELQAESGASDEEGYGKRIELYRASTKYRE